MSVELGGMRPQSVGSFSTHWLIRLANTASRNCVRCKIGGSGTNCNRCPASRRSRPSAASSGSIRSISIPTNCQLIKSRSIKSLKRSGRATTTWAGGWSSSPGANTWCAGAAIRSTDDVENIVVATNENGTPALVKHLGAVTLGPDLRRGVAELDGQGETVGAIVIMRSGENAQRVIERVRASSPRSSRRCPKA